MNASFAHAASSKVLVIGAGPAGLMAAEVLSHAGVLVDVFDAMPSAGRKFLLAGRGGLNLTHSEPLAPFIARFGAYTDDPTCAVVGDWLHRFGPQAVRDWAAGLGVQTFVGTSGRVFPVEMKAAPLLRAWLHRLRNPQAHGAPPCAAPVRFHMRHRWVGWKAGGGTDPVADHANSSGITSQFVFEQATGSVHRQAAAVVLALGGASWPRLGSDGAWVPWLAQAGVDIAPLVAANCGFDVSGRCLPDGTARVGWSPYLVERFAGQPLKNVVLSFVDSLSQRFVRRGEFVLTATGVEGSLIYAASRWLRDEIGRTGRATMHLNLLPDRTAAQVLAAVTHPRGSRSLSSHLKSRLGLSAVHIALLHEVLTPDQLKDPAVLAQAIAALPITLHAARPAQEAISTAGGVRWSALTPDLELRACPGVFCAGEMLDWEAPTGGYLLTASLASGVRAAQGVLKKLAA
ncbi:NAD(P)/FAD-dependent oxidoreductase [Ottowia sp.]|uniref:NAD(P)/FAD-dependent oxidoreductase n=1 Tax=Ottowia sp. TaxID=1898956 RepID=UPI003A83C700